MDIDQANQTAVERMMESRPILRGVAPAAEVIPGMEPDLLLHAGPPIAWERMSGPLRGAILGALIFEGRADDEASARLLAESGRIRFAPCHDHDAVGPMAGVISPSMLVYVLEDAVYGRKTFSNLNEGYGKVLRYGAFSEDVLKRLRWMNETLGPALGEALADGDGLDLRATIAEALHMGDEGHNRNKAGSLLFLRYLAPRLARLSLKDEAKSEILQFIGDNALSILNPVMAACKAMTLAGHGVEGSTLVTVLARNGTDFGIRVSGLGEAWFTAPAAVPDGLYFPGFSAADANPDIGDSAITETAGIGGFAMAAAPAIVTFVGGHAQRRPQRHARDVRDHRRRAQDLQHAPARFSRHAHRDRPAQGGRTGDHPADQHRHRPPPAGRRAGGRRAGSTAHGDVRSGVGGLCREVRDVRMAIGDMRWADHGIATIEEEGEMGTGPENLEVLTEAKANRG